MAEVTAIRNNALPYPVYGVPYAVTFPILDADGDFVSGATGLNSERSLNGDTFADCTNEATEIATNSGMYYLLFTAAELTADILTTIVKTSSSGAKTTPIVLYPRKLVSLLSGTSAGGASGSITLPAVGGTLDDRWNGCLCVATIDGSVEARIIDDYVGSTKVASVIPDWNVTPDADDTFVIYLPEGSQLPTAEATSLADETRSANLLDQSKTMIAVIESQRADHKHQPSTGNIFFIDENNGDTTGNGATGGIGDPIDTWQDAHDTYGTDFGHDLYIMVAGAAASTTVHTEDIIASNGYSFTRGPGRDLALKPTANNTVAITTTGDGNEFTGFQVDDFDGSGSQVGMQVTDADFASIHHVWFNETRGDGVNLLRASNCFIAYCVFNGTGASGSGQGVHITGTGAGIASDNVIHNCHFANTGGTSILVDQGTTNDTEIHHNTIHNAGGWGVNLGASSTDAQVHSNIFGNNASGDINDGGTTSIIANNEQWAKQSLLVYAPFAIHIDTVDGAAGSVEGTNGTRGNPVSNLADAVTLEAGLGFKEYHIHGASSITLASEHKNWLMRGQDGATVNLGGENASGSHFECLTLTGDADSNDITARYCKLQSLTNITGTYEFCLLIDNVTIIAGDTYFFQCASGVAGTGTPYIDVDGDGANARNLHLRGQLGGIELRNHTSTDTTSFDCPAGQIIVAASGTGGTIAMRGNIDITDNASGAVSFSQNAAVNMTKINAEVDAALNTAIPGSPAADSINQRVAAIDDLSQASGAGDLAAIKVVTDALTAAAAAKLALSAAGIESGAAEAGTLSTTQMTTDLSEATDDHYIGAVIVWTSGVLAKQRSDITDSAGASGLLTFTAVTEAPSAGDTFVIL